MRFESRGQFTISLPEQTFQVPSFTFEGGQVIGVVGPPKARVDIFLRLLAASFPADGGILSPSPGRVRARTASLDFSSVPLFLDDVQIYQDKSIHKKIGAIFSEPDINILGRTVLEDYFSAMVAVDAPPEQQIATAALRNFGLSEKLNRGTEVLSGGEKQRLNCATATVGSRKVLVADFTSVTLDRDFMDFMCRVAKSFAAAGGLVIVGGLNPEDQQHVSISRWLLLEPVVRSVFVEEVKSTSLRIPSRRAEVVEIKAILRERPLGGTTIVRADNVYRRGITQPLSLAIKEREIVVLTGANGIGKSTFGQILVGRIKKRQIEGEPEFAKGVKPFMAPQSPSEMILGLDLNSERPDPQLRALCGLDEEGDGRLDPRWFSHGLQKLISVANAFRLSSGLTILDEPTSGMDLEQKKKLVGLINHFKDHALLIITHDPSIECLGRVLELKESTE